MPITAIDPKPALRKRQWGAFYGTDHALSVIFPRIGELGTASEIEALLPRA